MTIDRIKEARLLFLNKGIMKREFIRNEIGYSWARSQVLSVDPESLNFKKNSSVKKLNFDKKLVEDYPMIEAIILVTQDGNVEKEFQQSDSALYKNINYLESSIGTHGIALAISTGKNSYTSSYEHYHQVFFDKLTYGIPFKLREENKVLGFILKQSTAEFLENQENYNLLATEIIKIFERKKVNLPENSQDTFDTLYMGYSEKMKQFKESIYNLKMMNNNLFIFGEKGSGKETVARIIHSESTRKNQKFYTVYCDKLPTNIIVDDIFGELNKALEEDNEENYGTVYCESFETLSYKSQDVLMKLLESKLINSKPLNTSNTKGFRFIFSSEKTLDSIRFSGQINERLLNRINVFTVMIPSLQEIREDIPALIISKIKKYSAQYFLDHIIFDDTLMDQLICYKWPENYRELDKVIEEIVYKGRYEKVINSTYLPRELSKDTKPMIKLKTLESTEQEEILKALELLNSNIALTAKALGIGRSTLYRKLDKYNIKY